MLGIDILVFLQIVIRKFGNCSTLIAPVEFDKCIFAIKENAFVASQYPVIITLEDLNKEREREGKKKHTHTHTHTCSPTSSLLCSAPPGTAKT